MLFRYADDTEKRAALFLTQIKTQIWTIRPEDVTWAQFKAALDTGQVGRVLLYVADYMTDSQCLLLFFAPDGTGFAVHWFYHLLADFRWDDLTPLTWTEFLAADPDSLRPLCDAIFSRRVNPHLTNPYIDASLGNTGLLDPMPHTFECGSEAELRRLTLAIVHSDPDVWQTKTDLVRVAYRGRTPTKRGYMRKTSQGSGPHPNSPLHPFVSGRLQSLCDLAFRLNTFTGVSWTLRTHLVRRLDAFKGPTYVPQPQPPNRLGNFDHRVHTIEVIVQPPSAHERAESLLLLNDWLTGKVSDARRLELLGIDAETI